MLLLTEKLILDLQRKSAVCRGQHCGEQPVSCSCFSFFKTLYHIKISAGNKVNMQGFLSAPGQNHIAGSCVSVLLPTLKALNTLLKVALWTNGQLQYISSAMTSDYSRSSFMKGYKTLTSHCISNIGFLSESFLIIRVSMPCSSIVNSSKLKVS